jgi:hypothetical protein
MGDTEIRITIDANGNIHRETVEVTQSEFGKPKLLKRLTSNLISRKTAPDNR